MNSGIGTVNVVDDVGVGSKCRKMHYYYAVSRASTYEVDGKSQPDAWTRITRACDAHTAQEYRPHRWTYRFSSAPSDDRPESPIDMAIIATARKTGWKFRIRGGFDSCAWAGEVTQDGKFLPLNNPLSVAFAAKQAGCSNLFVPADSAPICAAVGGIRVIGVVGTKHLSYTLVGMCEPYVPEPELSYDDDDYCDIKFVKGQRRARRALEIAVAGGHNLLLIGPPGEGKSLLAKCAGGISPALSMDESIEVSAIHQAAGKTDKLLHWRPVRMVDPTVTKQALVGGGSTTPYPGEVTLAHRGVLFIDEILQCNRSTIEALRGPMQDGYVTISRVGWKQLFPAQFQLIAAANPCPCGYYGHPDRECTCGETLRSHYMHKLSGPLLDRVPLRVFVKPLTLEEKLSSAAAEDSASVRARVEAARQLQASRYAAENIACNDELDPSIMHLVNANDDGVRKLQVTCRTHKLSSRGVDNTLKVARTIADLAGDEEVGAEAVREAVEYLDWNGGK